MNFKELLDQLVIPRANGSEGLVETAKFIESTLLAQTSNVELQTFIATPYGVQLMIATLFSLALVCTLAMLRGRHGLALLLSLTMTGLAVVETEMLWTPVSGLLTQEEQNIVARFPGRVGQPTLVFAAHYDTATQFGDHYSWERWGIATGVALLVLLLLPLAGLWQRYRKQRQLPGPIVILGTVFAMIPFAVMAWFMALGPLLAKPGPGALDNGGSVAVLLRLAEDLATRSADAPTTIELVFLAGEEERGFGSWHHAGTLAADAPAYIINLEMIGASEQFVYGLRETFLVSYYPPSNTLVRLIDDTLSELGDEPLFGINYPGASMTDARSFLAQGIPAVTLLAAINGEWPRQLHGTSDSRDRLSMPALEHTLELLNSIVARVDQNPLPGI